MFTQIYMALSGQSTKTELPIYISWHKAGMKREEALFCLYSPEGKVPKGTTVCPPRPHIPLYSNGSKERPYQNNGPPGPGVRGK